ncbi:FACT complex subunit [Cladochytrium tenue]|nr:FACT complex subunit [Cladochytrium tenue]
MMGDPAGHASSNPAPKIGKTFENVYLGGQNGPQVETVAFAYSPHALSDTASKHLILGKLRLADLGVGFQEAVSKKALTMAPKDIKRASWQRCARGYELRIETSNGLVHRFDGFQTESFDLLADLMERYYGVTLEPKEVSLRGYNWGKADFRGSTLNFQVQNRPAFEIPLAEVSNTATVGKNEVSIELVGPPQPPPNPETGRRPRIREDALFEVHFYVPGMAVQSQVDESAAGKKIMREAAAAAAAAAAAPRRDGEEEGEIRDDEDDPVYGEDGEALTAAAIFCETIKSRADVGVAHEESIVSFDEVLCLAPRGRYEMDMFETFFRIRGKSHDYRILFTSIKGLFLVPKPDDIHHMFVIQLDPPVRQGQTRYPFLIFQFDRDEETEATIKLDEYGN